jgi:hypothetical protein
MNARMQYVRSRLCCCPVLQDLRGLDGYIRSMQEEHSALELQVGDAIVPARAAHTH